MTPAALAVYGKSTPDIKTELKGAELFIEALSRKCHLERSGPDVHVTGHKQAKYLYYANRRPYSNECNIRW